MKKLMIIGLMIFIGIGSSNLQAQTIAGQRGKVERLERKIERQKNKIKDQKKKVEEAEKKVQEEIDRLKEEAKRDPKSHGVLKELNDLRDKLKKEQEKLEKEEQKLKELEQELKEEQEKRENKTNDAIDEILKKNPMPDTEEELDEYEKKMQKLETSPRNSKTEEELRRRIQERIDAKRKELEEHGALPGHQNQGFGSNDSNWKRVSIEEAPSAQRWMVGGHYTAWFSKGEEYPNIYFEDIAKETYSDTELTERLLEKLGGEFHIGSFSAPGSFTKYEYKIPQFFGVNGAFWLNDHIGFEAGLEKGKSSTTAEFPITVFDFENGMTNSTFGKLENNRDIYATYLHMQYLFYVGYLRAVFGVGVDYQKINSSTLDAIIGDQRFTVKDVEATSNISPSAQFGLQMKVSKRIYLEAKMNTKLMEQKLEAGVQLGIQIKVSK